MEKEIKIKKIKMKKSELRKIVKESVRTFLIEQATDKDKELSRAFGGKPLPKMFNEGEFTEVCIKNMDPGTPGGQGGGTACSRPPCGNCGSCTCIEVKKPTGKTAMGEAPEDRGICIKNVEQHGIFNQHITFTNCGPCKEGNVCPGGCFCIGIKK